MTIRSYIINVMGDIFSKMLEMRRQKGRHECITREEYIQIADEVLARWREKLNQ